MVDLGHLKRHVIARDTMELSAWLSTLLVSLVLPSLFMFLQKGPQSWAPHRFKTAAAPPAPWLLARLAGHLRTWWASPVALARTTPEALLEGCPHTKATLWAP